MVSKTKMRFLLLTLIACLASYSAQCTRGQDSLVLSFDDLQVEPYGALAVPWPYNDFLVSRGSGSGFPDPHIPVVNTTNTVMDIAYYVVDPLTGNSTGQVATKTVNWADGAVTRPNVILTTQEALVLKQSPTRNNRTFVLQSLSLMSIYIDQLELALTLTRYLNNGSSVVYQMPLPRMPIGVRTDVVVGYQFDAHQVTISCLKPGFYTCAHVIYDNITLCYKHSR